MVNLNLVNRLILTAFMAIFAGIGTITDRVGAADPLSSQGLTSSPKILPPNSQLTAPRIGAPIRSTEAIVSPSNDLQVPDWALLTFQQLSNRYHCTEKNTPLVGIAASKKLKPQLVQELDRSPFSLPVV